MRIAVIDCGTNTFNMIVANIFDSDFTIVDQHKLPVKLAAHGYGERIITTNAIHTAVSAYKNLHDKASSHNVDKIVSVGTAALRNASNANELLQQIKSACGQVVEIISGHDEADLIARGMLHAIGLLDGNLLLLDIGGGSCEFIICNKHNVLWRESYEMGAALILDKFRYQEPYSNTHIEAMESFITRTTTSLATVLPQYMPTCLIGAAGSFETFAEIIEMQYAKQLLPTSTIMYPFYLPHYYELHQQLLHTTVEEKTTMPGMWPPRADMIAIASIITTFALRISKIKKMMMCRYSLREGLLLREIDLLN